ncbi:MAG: WD40 repeat domain-containing protein [Bacteroidota bacterium]
MKKIELAHDILAEEVFNNSSGLQRMRRKVESRISKKFSDFRDNEILVSKGELHNLILPYLGIVNISSEERSFVLEMERMHANKDAAKKKKYRNRIFGLIVITIFFIILSIFSLVQMTKAETELQQKKAILYAYSSVTALEEGYPSFAFHLAERALSFNELPEEYASQISREVIDKVYQQPLIKDISFDDKIITFKFFNSSDNFITCSEDGFLRLWSPNGRLKNEFELDGNVENLEILQNDKHISILSRDRKLSFYALENGDLIKVKDYTNVVSCKFYGNNYGLVAKENGKVLILETQKMEVLSSFHIGTYAAKTGLLIINGLKPYVLAKKEDQQIYLLNFDGELFFEEAFFDVSPIRREDEIESFSISQNGELIIFNTTKGDFILDNLGDILKINGTDFFSINQMDHSRSYFGPHGLEVQ